MTSEQIYQHLIKPGFGTPDPATLWAYYHSGDPGENCDQNRIAMEFEKGTNRSCVQGSDKRTWIFTAENQLPEGAPPVTVTHVAWYENNLVGDFISNATITPTSLEVGEVLRTELTYTLNLQIIV